MLSVLAAVNMVNWADRSVVPILFPPIRAEMGLTDTQLGVIGGLSFSVVYAVAAFGFGWAADRYRRRKLIMGGLVVWSLATAASGLATDFWSLFAARFFTGIGEASLYPAAMSLIAERFPIAQRGKAMGAFGAAAALGSGAGVALGGFLAEALGWRQVFFFYGAGGLLLLPFLASVTEDVRAVRHAESERSVSIVVGFLRDGRLMWLWMTGMVMIGSAIGYAAWVPSYFERVRGMDLVTAGYLFGAANAVGGIFGALLGGVFADRMRRRRLAGETDVSTIAALMTVPFLFLTLLSPAPAMFMIGALLTSVAAHAFFPSMQTVMFEISPAKNHGLVYATHILFLGGIGSALGPLVVGYVSDVSGSLLVAMSVPAIGILAASAMARRTGKFVRARTPDPRTANG